jgi:hypothetical protein
LLASAADKITTQTGVREAWSDESRRDEPVDFLEEEKNEHANSVTRGWKVDRASVVGYALDDLIRCEEKCRAWGGIFSSDQLLESRGAL